MLALCLCAMPWFSASAQESSPPTPGLANGLSARLPEQSAPRSRDTQSRNREGRASFGLLTRRFDDVGVNTRYARTDLGLDLAARLTDWLGGSFRVEQTFVTGASSQLYAQNEGGANQRDFKIHEAALELRPFAHVSLKSGILVNGLSERLSVMDSQSWMGGEARLAYINDLWRVALSASQAIPQSDQTSLADQREEFLPLFTTAKLRSEIKATQWGSLVRFDWTRFWFTDLSSKAAQDSQTKGSTVVTSGNTNGDSVYRFGKEYVGNEFTSGISQRFAGNLEAGLFISQLVNEQGEGAGQGLVRRIEFGYSVRASRALLQIDDFLIQSDAVPAVYGQSRYGFTNRSGRAVSAELHLPKDQIRFFASYARANKLDESASASLYQSDREIYAAGAEVVYEIF